MIYATTATQNKRKKTASSLSQCADGLRSNREQESWAREAKVKKQIAVRLVERPSQKIDITAYICSVAKTGWSGSVISLARGSTIDKWYWRPRWLAGRMLHGSWCMGWAEANAELVCSGRRQQNWTDFADKDVGCYSVASAWGQCCQRVRGRFRGQTKPLKVNYQSSNWFGNQTRLDAKFDSLTMIAVRVPKMKKIKAQDWNLYLEARGKEVGECRGEKRAGKGWEGVWGTWRRK